MDSTNLYKLLKWVLVVLVAGFIAQFGKHFATRLIERAKRKKRGISTKIDSVYEDSSKSPEAAVIDENRTDAKTNKKALKAFIKGNKKGK